MVRTNPNVLEAISRFNESIIAPYRAVLDKVVWDIIYASLTIDVLDFQDTDGNILPLDSIPRELRPAITSLKKSYAGRDAHQVVKELGLISKLDAIKLYKDLIKTVGKGAIVTGKQIGRAHV